MADSNTTPPPAQQLRNQRSPDFEEIYANNALFELSAWDLKVIFGQLDQAMGTVNQHTAITIPWSLAKLALYQLRLQVQAYELFYGPIRITDDLLPIPPPAPTGEMANNPKFVQIYEAAKKLHEEFVAQAKGTQ